ncbi:MAG: low specificity L-threonine aldolase [Anaerolineales bacterium]|nr:low specificity L-threonine aldolase [Anaerolineales bacterium]
MRHFSHHKRLSPKTMLTQLAEWTDADLDADRYGQGDLISTFEVEIAELLGKDAAVFMPSGTMAQQIALRIWCDRQDSNHIAFHPLAHLQIHEQMAYEKLHGLQATLVGESDRLMTLDDVQQIEQPLATLLIELPQREIGGQLPTWAELEAITGYAREQGVRLHMDGARLWECQPFYQRSYAEIAALFDSVYVSFYKIMQGIAGAVLAGPQDFIDEARIWQRRHGGNLVMLYPYVLSAKMGMQQHFPRIPEYVARAKDFAAAIQHFPQIAQISPNPPQTNMMHVQFDMDVEVLRQALANLRDNEGIEISWGVSDSGIIEFSIGEANLEFELDEIVAVFDRLFAYAVRE